MFALYREYSIGYRELIQVYTNEVEAVEACRALNETALDAEEPFRYVVYDVEEEA